MASYNLNASQTAIFDSNGTASVTFSPPSLEYWDITSMAVRTSDGPNASTVPIANITLDGVDKEGTYSGNFDTTDTPYHVEKGQVLKCTWTGGTLGKTATFTVNGTRTNY
jgi:hypothetical protein